MATTALEPTENPTPTFAAFLASRLPLGFLNAARPLIGASYEEAFQGTPVPDGELPYRNNLLPHNRNKLVFEHLHQLADGLGMSPVARALDNGYFYLEIESKGLSVHIKHRNAYQSLKEQMVKADYRRQMTSINLPFGQMPLFADDKPMAIPGQAYVILFYDDSAVKRSEVGDIYFILPSNEEGNILGYSKIEDVIASSAPTAQQPKPASTDIIDLPSNQDESEEKEAK
jgi:hypothetical protein